MDELTLESLAKRVAALEATEKHRAGEPAENDWWGVVGMFNGSEFHERVVAEGAAIRQAERDAIVREDAEREAGERGVA